MLQTPSSPSSSSSPPSPSFWSCSPLAIFGGGLILAQLVIFRISSGLFDDSIDIDYNVDEAATTTTTTTTVGLIPGSVQSSRNRFLGGRRPIRRKNRAAMKKEIDNADGTFNGYPIYYKEEKDVHTSPHCVGENYQAGKAWMHRSCRFDFFCFDTDIQEYVVYQARDEENVYEHLKVRPYVDLSQSYLKRSYNQSNTVALGGINLKWTMKANGVPRLEWFPEIRMLDDGGTLSFYELPPTVAMVPFHSMNGENPGHLVWDDFLPIYTLLTMFQMEDDSDLLMMRYILKDGRGLWASCDFRDEKYEACKHMHKKFLPLMMGKDPLHDITTTKEFSFETAKKKSNLVCSRRGLVGIGALTDHGPTKMHGWEEEDYQTTHNHGRGGMLYEFRNYMMENMEMPIIHNHKPPFRIVFSINSSREPSRLIDFAPQIKMLQNSFNPNYVSIESYVFQDLSLEQQLDIMRQTSIFITGCGGGAVSATFLPRGASLFLYYIEDGGVKYNQDTGKPARLDWDLFNNMSYLKVHWLPKTTMKSQGDLRSLALLVQHELDGLMREHSYDKFFT